MVIDQTLRGFYAMNAPVIPEWYLYENAFARDDTISEEIFFKWRWYYADRMIEQEFKK